MTDTAPTAGTPFSPEVVDTTAKRRGRPRLDPAERARREEARRAERAARPNARTRAKQATRKSDLTAGLALAYSMVGGGFSMAGARANDPAVFTMGRVMQAQAPVAGREFAKLAAAHPAIEALLAPIFGATEVVIVQRVIGPPLLAFALVRRPELLPVLKPVLLPMMYQLFRDLKTMDAKDQDMLRDLAAITDQTVDEANAEFQGFLAGFGLADEPSPSGSPEPPPPFDGSEAVAEPGGDAYDEGGEFEFGEDEPERPVVGMGRSADQ